jgi:AcrR family transcriptional regulator
MTVSFQNTELSPGRQRILAYTRSKFFSEGFQRTTIEDIARELAISKNTIYKYFPNKEKLVFEVFSDFISGVSSEVEKIVGSDENAVQKFINLILTISAKIMAFSDKLFRDLQLHAPQIWVKIDTLRKQMMQKNLGKIIDQGINEGLFINYPAEIIQAVFIASLRSVVNPEFLLNNKISKQDAIKYTFNILLSGSLTKKGLLIFKKLKLPQ